MSTQFLNPHENRLTIASDQQAFPQQSWIAWLIIATACLLAVAPFAWQGIPSGHDFEFHMFSWMDVLSQWRQGILYPRWAAMPHWGYGEPRFLFYPPFSWILGAALGSMLPWKLVPAVYCWLSLTLAGGAMYHLARRWLSPSDALFAAIFYALNPYHLLIIYWRSAYAELLTSALLPLLLLILLQLKEPGFRPTLQLSLLLAAAWLTNVPASVMIHYSAAVICLLLAVRHKTFRPLTNLALAVLLGAGLASIYLVPAIYEQRWIDIAQVFSPGVRPQDHFLFTMTADPDHNRFNRLVSFVVVADIAILLCAIFFSRRERSQSPLWKILAMWGGATAFATLSFSNVLWKYLPAFHYVQLPFRWLLCTNVANALLLAMATVPSAIWRWSARALVCVVLLAVIIIAGLHTQPPWWVTADDLDDMQQSMIDGSGNEGVDEYVPAGADSYELNKDLPQLSIAPTEQPDSQSPDAPTNETPMTDATDGNPPTAAVKIISQKIIKWSATDKSFQVFTDNPCNLTVRLFNYPAWKVKVNGRNVTVATSPVTGLIVVPINSGENDVEIEFTRTRDRTLGDAASILSAAIFVLLWIKTRPRGDKHSRPFPQESIQENVQRAQSMKRTVLIATSNAGKLRDFAGAATAHGISIAGIPGFSALPPVVEDGLTFEANARKKAEEYSRSVPGELVLADDSGLEIDALHGAPGVHSARYAAPDLQNKEPHAADCNTDDDANNARVLRELANVPMEKRTARFVCVLAAARDGQTLATFRGTAEGLTLDAPRGTNGFGYDPLFYFPQIGKTFAELSAEEKSRYSHRGAAFRAFLDWCRSNHECS